MAELRCAAVVGAWAIRRPRAGRALGRQRAESQHSTATAADSGTMCAFRSTEMEPLILFVFCAIGSVRNARVVLVAALPSYDMCSRTDADLAWYEGRYRIGPTNQNYVWGNNLVVHRNGTLTYSY